MKIIGAIQARYKSARFPGKPSAEILGKPMIWWVYQQCLKVSELDEVIVAIDDSRIESVCRQYGKKVVMTSDKHSIGSDRVGEDTEKIAGNLFINIQGNGSVIGPEMILQVIRIFDDPAVYFATLKREITNREQIVAPSTVKVVTDVNGDALYFSRSVIPSNLKDGNLAKTYRHVEIYAYKRDFLLKYIKMPQPEIERGEGIEPLRAMYNGYRIRVAETEYDGIDVDLPEHIDTVIRKLKETRNEQTC